MIVNHGRTTIHPDIIEVVGRIKKRMDELGHPPISELTPEQSRFFHKEAIKFYHLHREEGVEVKERQIERLKHPVLPIRIYTPTRRSDLSNPYPVLVYFQGGGWVFGDLDSVDAPCSFLARYASCIVVSVQYRKAPEHKYPLPMIDAADAVKWVRDHAPNFNGNPNRLAVGGESSGGNLAAAVAIQLRDEGKIPLVAQLLINPVTQYGFDTPSYRAGHRKGLSLETMQWFWSHYLKNHAQGQECYASPLRVEDGSHLPPTLMVTAEHDPLRDDGLMYAEHLKSFQVPVKTLHYGSFIHSFILMIRVVEEARNALHEIAVNLKEML